MYIKYYVNAVRVVFLSLVPFILLIFFSVKIYKRFLRTRARYRRGSNTAQVCAFFYSWLLFFQILFEHPGSNSRLSEGKGDLKQKCMQLLTPFFSKVFGAVSQFTWCDLKINCCFWSTIGEFQPLRIRFLGHKVKAPEIKDQKMASEKLCAFFFESTLAFRKIQRTSSKLWAFIAMWLTHCLQSFHRQKTCDLPWCLCSSLWCSLLATSLAAWSTCTRCSMWRKPSVATTSTSHPSGSSASPMSHMSSWLSTESQTSSSTAGSTLTTGKLRDDWMFQIGQSEAEKVRLKLHHSKGTCKTK